MKINKKAIVTTGAVLGVAALVAGGTIAYFTDHETATNNFTVGDIDITLYESQLHRVNSNQLAGVAGIDNTVTPAPEQGSNPHNCAATAGGSYNKLLIYCTPDIILGTKYATISGVSAWDNNHVALQNVQGQTGVFTDAQIIADAEGTGQIGASTGYAYYDGVAGGNAANATEGSYVYDEYKNIVPGKNIRKLIYVKNNENTNDAYVRVKLNVPASVVNYVTVNTPSTSFSKSNTAVAGPTKDGKTLVKNYYQCGGKDGTIVPFKGTPGSTSANVDYTADGEYNGFLESDGSRTYTFYLSEALEAGELTYWSPVNTILLNENLTQADISNLQSLQEDGFGITVTADAVQADTFTDVAEAFTTAGV